MPDTTIAARIRRLWVYLLCWYSSAR